jgi:tetratricopeptide (TPR) repeat protein
MMIEQHYDEEVLAGFLSEPIDLTSRDKHLSSCSLCKRTLASIRETTGVLKSAEVWESASHSTAPRPETLAFVRNVQRVMADEDALAEVYAKQLLAGTRDSWSARLAAHPEWRTGGMVRKLIAATDSYNFSSPLDAVELTRLLTDVADSLPHSIAGRDSLVADAWREHAYAQVIVGSYREAMEAVNTAERLLENGSEFARARTTLMRAMVLRGMERWSEAAPMAQRAASDFRRFGDVGKEIAARIIEAAVLYDCAQYRQAAEAYGELASYYSRMPEQTMVMAMHNEGLCLRELGLFERAEQSFIRVIEISDRLQMTLTRAKATWHLARVMMRQSRYDEALQMLNPLRREFEELGVSDDLACASIDTAECLLALEKTAEVPALCRQAIDYFRSSGLAYSTGAMTALAYLQETAISGQLTVNNVADVRVFVERLPKTPNAVFLSSFS